MQDLLARSAKNQEGATCVMNIQNEKNAATYAQKQSDIKSEMSQAIEKKKEEHQSALSAFLGSSFEKEKLVDNQKQEIGGITKSYEDKLQAHKANYEQLNSMIQNLRARSGL